MGNIQNKIHPRPGTEDCTKDRKRRRGTVECTRILLGLSAEKQMVVNRAFVNIRDKSADKKKKFMMQCAQHAMGEAKRPRLLSQSLCCG